MIPYIINVGLIVAGCLAFYKIFLHKETFYRLNRSVLLICLAVAFSLPLIPVPQQWSLRKTEAQVTNSPFVGAPQEISRKHFPSALRSKSVNPDVLVAQPEATSPLSRQAAISKSEPALSFSQFIKWMIWLYWFGVIVFGLNFLLQFGLLIWRAYANPVIFDGKFRIVEMSGDQAPCSFMNNIFINPHKYDWNIFNQILEHEKVHVSERHSLDILFAELMLVFQWFNPFAWLYRKEVENNLEFLTDDTVLHKSKLEICSYQMSLLRVSAAHLPLSLTTNYNQSLLKKRIAMMNAKKSSLNTSWKYFFLIPMLALFACLFNEPVVQAQTKSPTNTKNANSTENKTNVKNASSSKNRTSTKNVTNQKDGDSITEVIIRKNVKTGETDTIYEVKVRKNKDQSWKENENHDGDLKTEGYWFATIDGDKIRFQLSNSDKKDNSSYSGSEFSLSDFPSLPKVANADFKLTRDAGTMNFNGKFEGDQGKGKYKFVGDKSYSEKVGQSVEEKLTEEELLVFFLIDIKKSFVQMLSDEGYNKLEKDELISLAAMKVDKELITALKENGYKNVDAEELVSVKAMNIDGQYIKEIRDAGYKDITLEELVSFKAMGIDKNYINKVSKFRNDNKNLDAEDLVSLKAMEIDEDYANQFKALGYTDLSTEDLISMKAVGVTPEFIKAFQAAGYKKLEPDDLVSLKAMNVTPEYLKSFQAAGFKELEADDLASLKSMNVTPAYIKSFQAIGYKEIEPEDAISLKSMKITPEYIKGFQALGYKNIPLDHIISAKSVGITPEYVKRMKAKGFNYNNLEKYVTLKSLAYND